MYSSEVNSLGKRHVNGFLGVFPLDKIPKHIGKAPKSFIVNTDTHNLPGQHWLAVSYERGGIVRASDPLGFYYPPLLMHTLHKSSPNARILYNFKMYQKPWERNCGQHCLRFLYSRSPKQRYKQSRYNTLSNTPMQ